MPVFNFKCPNGHIHEALIRTNDPLPPCPECGYETRKLPSTFNFKLKGDGWARDGYSGKQE